MSEHTKITDAGSDLLVVEQLNAMELFTGQAMDPLIEQIKALVDRHVPDVSTARGRGDIASLARRVASSKVILDDLGKDLVADWKEKAKKVDIVRKKMRDELDALRDRAREPLTLWEQAEAERLRQVAFERTYSLAWDEAHAEHPRVRNVIHAVNLARHSAKGWNDPALPDDITEICKLLGLTEEALMERLRRMVDIPADEVAPAAEAPPEA